MQPQPESSADAPPPHRRREPPPGSTWRNRVAGEQRRQAEIDAEQRRRTLELIAHYDECRRRRETM
jgi:hypothetical protein